MKKRIVRSIAAAMVAALCLWPVATAAQTLPALADSGLSTEQIGGAFASAGFQVDDPLTWNWTSPPLSALHVLDVANGRVLMVLVYPNAAAALTARLQAERSEHAQKLGLPIAGDRGPHLVMGYGESVWLSNLAMIQTTQSELDSVYQALNDRDNGMYVSTERVQQTSQPRFAVDPDFLQALTNSVVNL